MFILGFMHAKYYVHLYYPFETSENEWSTIIRPIVQTRKLRHREDRLIFGSRPFNSKDKQRPAGIESITLAIALYNF